MLQSATFTNFTIIPDSEWQFANGINVIIGENGVGKSHVLKALYSLLKAQADTKDFTDSWLAHIYAKKLLSVLRPESLGRLVKRRQGRGRCEINLSMADNQQSVCIGFASNAKSQVDLLHSPSSGPKRSPAYLPTRELVTLCPWFSPLYDNYHIEFEEIWRDTVSLLGAPSLKGPREKHAAALLNPLEHAMGGKVVVDAVSGRFYLQIPGEGKMEMPLVAEGLRKIAMLARLISTGTLLEQGYLFWDEPETNLNPKLIKTVAESIIAVANSGVQIFIATHSLFLLRELEMLLSQPQYQALARRWFALANHNNEINLQQSTQLDDIQTLVLLDEELAQAGRFIDWSNA